MCHECNQITLEMETLVMLAEAERLVIDAEAQSGASVAGAVRPMFPHEVDAKVRFGDIEGLTASAAAEATQVLEGLREVIVGAVMGEMLGDADTVTPADAGRALAQLNAAQPVPVQTAVARTAAALQGILANVATGAGAIVVEEAKRQGLTLANYTPPVIDPEQFKLPAATAALHPWQRITGKLQAVILDPSKVYAESISRDDVTKHLDSIPLDGTTDMARQTIHSAHGIGRNETAATLEPSAVYASEIMDGNTCRPCSLVDSKRYGSLAEARVEYPHGGYDACLGGTRCRGTLVFMYDEPASPPDPSPDPLPPIAPPEPDPAPVKPPRKRAPRKPKVAPIVPDPTPAPLTPPVRPVDTPVLPPAPEPPAAPQTRKQALANERNKAPLVPPVRPAAPAPAPAAVPGLPPAPTATPPKPKPGHSQRYDALDQLPIQATAPGPKKKGALMVMATDMNPGYASGSKNYSRNCSSVSTAYEMRRRGYDVYAAPVENGQGRWHGEYVNSWWRNADGTPAEMKYAKDLPMPLGMLPTKTLPGGAIGLTGTKMTADMFTKHKMELELLTYPDGARGYIATSWTQGAGHVWNWEKVDGKIVYLEGQTGVPEMAFDHLTPGKFKYETLRYVRMDDKVPTDAVAQALETRPSNVSITATLTSAEKKAKSHWRMKTGPKGIEYLPPEFRKNKSNRWEPIPEAERAQMLADFMKKGGL